MPPQIIIQGYVFDVEDNTGPRAVITPAQQESVIGAIVKVDGRASFDTAVNPSGVINYHWSFARVPIGSQAEHEGFTPLDPDSSVVTFSPDVTGFYEIQLIVDDGSIDSPPFIAGADISVIVVPNNKGIIPDASFMWQYLSDFWTRVEEKAKFEVFWSAAIQIVSAELLKQYQYDYNKSIRDIQKVFQKRWVNYPSGMVFDRAKISGILAEDQAGLSASTSLLDTVSSAPLDAQPDFSDLVLVPLTEGNFVTTSFNRPVLPGRVLSTAGHSFTMSRSNLGVKAVNEGTDGSTVVTTDQFGGSGFELNYVGYNLRILTGVNKGTYLIASVIDSGDLTVTTLAGDPVSFTAESDLSYTIVPGTNSVSNFFADQKTVPTELAGQPWRFSSTLVSTEYDFEAQGVSIGDVVEVEITRLDLLLVGKVYFQVVGVDRARLSFVFNLDDLTDGTTSKSLSKQAQIDLAGALKVTGLLIDNTGTLQYALEAGLVKSTVSSQSFKRTFFETVITTETEIDLGAFKIKARPIQVIRNSKIAVDGETVSIPVLQEYIRQPDLAELDGQTQIVSRSGKMFPVDHKPYVLAENLDFIIDNEAQIAGVAQTVINSDVLHIPRGDLIDRSIQSGDIIVLTTGATQQIYNVRKVLDPENVRVFPTPIATDPNVPFKLTRRTPGKFIRFTKGTFSKSKRCPTRLWAELTYFSNDSNIEANFGVLVGVTRDDLTRRNVQAPYKSVVEGLMYALVQGPVQENLRLSAQILLGLPFAVNTGVIIEINPSFQTRTDGSPSYGRILIEARNKSNQKTGITDVYLYPQGRQLPDLANPGKWLPATPNESGLAINPATAVEYTIGDTVSKFAVLSKGVDVSDYISDTSLTQQLVEQGTLEALITQYHSFKLRINSDITSPSDIDLTTEFIKTAKPHYVKISAGLLKIIEDFVAIEDSLTFKLFYNFFENTSFSLPSAVKFDPGLGETSFITVDGTMYSRYWYGTDLDTTFSSSNVFSTAGGFITAAGDHYYDAPFIRGGDLLVISAGPNSGKYGVASVSNDNTITLSGSPAFETELDQTFRIYRPIKNPIMERNITVTNGSANAVLAAGGFSAGIAVGDVVTFTSGSLNSSQKYLICDFNPTTNQIVLSRTVAEATGTYSGHIWRDGLTTQYLLNTATDTPFTAGFTNGNSGVVFVAGSSDLAQLSFIKIGDHINRGTDTFLVLDYDPTALTAYVTPTPTFTASAQPVSISREYRPATPISPGTLESMPVDELFLTIKQPTGQSDLTTTASSATVGTISGRNFVSLGIRPGDFLVVLAGADAARNIGYGAGIFPILSLPSTTTLSLTRPLTANSPGPGLQYGIQRRKPQL